MTTPLFRLLAELSGTPVGQRWQRKISHPYFEDLTFFCTDDIEDWYWEAKLPIPGSNERVTINIDDTPEGPTERHETFCKSVLADHDGLFEMCRAVFEPEFVDQAGKPWPADWRSEFKLSYLAPPIYRDDREWQACYFVSSVGLSFTAFIRDGVATSVLVGD